MIPSGSGARCNFGLDSLKGHRRSTDWTPAWAAWVLITNQHAAWAWVAAGEQEHSHTLHLQPPAGNRTPLSLSSRYSRSSSYFETVGPSDRALGISPGLGGTGRTKRQLLRHSSASFAMHLPFIRLLGRKPAGINDPVLPPKIRASASRSDRTSSCSRRTVRSIGEPLTLESKDQPR